MQCSGKLWQAVLKKGSTSSAVSSTTAQGFLPQYRGHAAASLSPSINENQASSSRDITPSKFLSDIDDLNEGGALVMPASGKCSPNGVGAVENRLGGLSLHSPDRSHLSPAFNV